MAGADPDPMSTAIDGWLSGLGLGKYSEVFRANDIDHRALPHLTEADLRELGVSLGHRRILLAAIAGLAPADAPPPHEEGWAQAPLAPASPAPAPEPPRPEPPRQEADRRLLSVLFCDLAESTALSQRLDPEELRDLLRRYQDAVAGAVTRYGGHVAKYLGDGVLAYFGWPRAHEDQAERAIRAALEAMAAVRATRTPDGTPLDTRIGIATGQVVVGDLEGVAGREEGAIAGHTPNLAARLQAAAERGQVLVAEATRRLIGGAFALDDLGPQALKGFAEPVRAFRVLGERPVESRLEAARPGALTALVGRVHELGLLLERWRAAGAGQGQVVLVSGEAGIGKSRLVQALLDRVAEHARAPVRLQCWPHHAGSAFHPVIERLARLAGFSPEDGAAERLDKLERMLAGTGENPAAAVPVCAGLLSLDTAGRCPPPGLAPPERKERTLAVLVGQLLSGSDHGPVLLVIEDVHWADPSTVELCRRLAEAIPRRPVMMVVTRRPEGPVDGIGGLGHVTSLTVGRLDRGQIAELLGGILGRPPDPALLEDVARRSDGVPLFVEELGRVIAERGGEGPGTIAGVPATLQGWLMARLDRVSPAAKTLALTASVIGQELDDGLLAAVAGIGGPALADALAELRQAQILVVGGAPRASHMFRHALLQDTAYQSLLSGPRRRLHCRVAELMETAGPQRGEGQPELIARHFQEAGEPERALPHWRHAAERALARSANFEAVGHAEQALALAEHAADPSRRRQESLAARLLLVAALETAGRLQDALTLARETVGLARSGGDRHAYVQAVLALDNVLFLSAEPVDESTGLLEDALDRVTADDDRARGEILSRLARASLILGDGRGALAYNRQAAELARRIGDRQSLFNLQVNDFLTPAGTRDADEVADWRRRLDAMARLAEGLDDDARGRTLSLDLFISAEMGDRDRMDAVLRRLAEMAETRQHLHLTWIAAHGHAMVAILDGDLAAAERHADTALALGSRTYGQHVEGIHGMQMFTIRREQGRLSEVAPVIKRLLDDSPGRTAWRPGFAVVASDLGFHDAARRILGELAAAGFTFPLDAKHSTTLAYLAEVCVALADESRAERLYTLLLPYRQMTVTAGINTVCLGAAARHLGLLAGVGGDWAAAEQHFETALAMNQRMRARPWLAHARHDYARMLARRGRPADRSRAQALLEEALSDARRFGMKALEQRLTAPATGQAD